MRAFLGWRTRRPSPVGPVPAARDSHRPSTRGDSGTHPLECLTGVLPYGAGQVRAAAAPPNADRAAGTRGMPQWLGELRLACLALDQAARPRLVDVNAGLTGLDGSRGTADRA